MPHVPRLDRASPRDQGDSLARPPAGRRTAIPPCPVNPSKGCIECHMPRVRIDSLHMELTDHYIRVRHRLDADGRAHPVARLAVLPSRKTVVGDRPAAPDAVNLARKASGPRRIRPCVAGPDRSEAAGRSPTGSCRRRTCGHLRRSAAIDRDPSPTAVAVRLCPLQAQG